VSQGHKTISPSVDLPAILAVASKPPAYNGVLSALTISAPQCRDAATPVTVTLKAGTEGLGNHTRHYRPPTSEVHPYTAPLPRGAALATGCYVKRHILLAQGASTPQAGLLPAPAPPLRTNKITSATIGPVRLSIRDSPSTAGTSPTTNLTCPLEISTTKHNPISESRQLGRVGSGRALWVSPNGLLAPSGSPRNFLLREVATRPPLFS